MACRNGDARSAAAIAETCGQARRDFAECGQDAAGRDQAFTCTIRNIAGMDCRWKYGGEPVSSSQMVAPTDHTSDAT
jgi:hypothetical protein